MNSATIVILLILFAVAVIPLTVGYNLWLVRSVLPKLAALPPRVARTVLAICIAMPWIVIAIIVWVLLG